MKSKLAFASILVSGAALLGVVVWRHQAPHLSWRPYHGTPRDYERVEPPPAEIVPHQEEAKRLDDMAVGGLVLDLKLAAVKNDESTQRGLIRGLRNHGAKARRALQSERQSATDPRIVAALDAALVEMP
jgi:hypothetical protein